MNARDIVKSVNLFMAIEWGELQALDELNIQFSLRETCIYSGRPYLKGDGRDRYDCSKRSKLPAT